MAKKLASHKTAPKFYLTDQIVFCSKSACGGKKHSHFFESSQCGKHSGNRTHNCKGIFPTPDGRKLCCACKCHRPGYRAKLSIHKGK